MAKRLRIDFRIEALWGKREEKDEKMYIPNLSGLCTRSMPKTPVPQYINGKSKSLSKAALENHRELSVPGTIRKREFG